MFKPGDHLICIDDDCLAGGITNGKKYIIDGNTYLDDDRFVRIRNDYDQTVIYYGLRFILDVKYYRKKKLERCLR